MIRSSRISIARLEDPACPWTSCTCTQRLPKHYTIIFYKCGWRDSILWFPNTLGSGPDAHFISLLARSVIDVRIPVWWGTPRWNIVNQTFKTLFYCVWATSVCNLTEVQLVRGHAGSSNRAIDIPDERIFSNKSVKNTPYRCPASIRPPSVRKNCWKFRVTNSKVETLLENLSGTCSRATRDIFFSQIYPSICL